MTLLEKILRAILLYSTIFSVTIFVCAVDDLYDKGYFIHGVIFISLLTGICARVIEKKDLNQLLP